MPSESRGWRLLRSQGLGVICGLSTVALLGIGSVIMAATHDGASKGVQMDDIRAFFEPPSPWHGWFYLLIPVLGLYALNTLLATIDSTVRKWRAGKRALWHHGPALIHISFLVALLAHLIGGVGGGEERPLMLGASWQDLGSGRQARVVDLKLEPHPNGQLKQVHARVEVREGSGASTTHAVGYNQPLSFGAGAQLFLLARYQQADVVTLSDGKAHCSAPVRGACQLSSGRVFYVLGIYASGHWGKQPAARLLAPGRGGKHRPFFLLGGRPERLADGATLTLQGTSQESMLLLRRRTAPGNPWALASALLLLLGVVSMGRRWWA